MENAKRNRSHYSKLAWLFAVFAAYILTRPYLGYYHDSLLYAAQALHRSGVADLSDDLFFRFGNQADLAAFPNLQGWLTLQIGADAALKVLTAAAAILWLLGLAMLGRTIYPARQLWLGGMAIALLMGAGYGNAALSYGEPFVTARPFAEAFGMMALSYALRDEARRGLLAMLACALCHPLVGLSVGGLWLALSFVITVRLVALLLLGLVCLIAIAQAGIEPASWLLERHDADWAALLHRYESLGFVTHWGWLPLRLHALGVVILLLCTRSPDKLIATIAYAALLVGVVFVGISVIGADLLDNRLIAALQPWRVLSWIVLLSNLLALHLLRQKPVRSIAFVLLVLAMAVNVVEHLVEVIPVFSTAMAPLVLIAHWSDRPGVAWRWFNAILAVIATLVVLAMGSFVAVNTEPGWQAALARIATAGLIALVFVVRGRGMAAVLTCLALFAALMQFDRRTPEMRFIESEAAMPQEVAQTLAGKTVYWEQGLGLMWIKLRQPQYYSCNQRAGTLFYRAQAIEHERRGQLLAPLNTLDFNGWPPKSCPVGSDPEARGPADVSVLEAICHAEPSLDHIVLRKDVAGAEMTRWILPIGAEGQIFYHADCDKLRSAPTAAATLN